MSPCDRQSPFWLAGSGLKSAIRFATYDWTRELPLPLRVITMIGMGIQGYAIWAALSRSLIWPIMWPSGVPLYATILVIYYIGFCIQNATLASELIRKTQLESEQLAAQKIQKTLQPTTIDEIPGYEVDAFYKPLRAVGGDYCPISRRWWIPDSTRRRHRVAGETNEGIRRSAHSRSAVTVYSRNAAEGGRAPVSVLQLWWARRMVDRIFARSNPLLSWLRQLEALRRAA